MTKTTLSDRHNLPLVLTGQRLPFLLMSPIATIAFTIVCLILLIAGAIAFTR